ncbi:uncharacterized protein LOC122231152 [Panthera tigris]|uniref:uncharacterized protein LOC122231152 n=1 Tax=Panthera tigris TaxID=9694 RepID=UPI001C6F602B|nr:uncharacterized protein LOC122231152 [Panthera tigris]XP_042814311.1 uncharacterized protein LOC122231152 [Panthera tigris]
MCQGMEACQQPSERAQTWLLQPHGSLEMILDPAESWTATSRETLSQNHPAEPLPDSIPSESITLLENSSREFTCSALLLHLVLKRFIIGPTLQEEFAMTETTSLKEGMDKGWPSASQHKRPQKPGHASALSSDFQPTERILERPSCTVKRACAKCSLLFLLVYKNAHRWSILSPRQSLQFSLAKQAQLRSTRPAESSARTINVNVNH